MRFVVVSALCAIALSAQTPSSPPKPAVPETHPGPAPQPVKPAATPASNMVRFDVSAIDKTADPCSDFFQYACGNWMKNNPIPPDQSRWGRFSELQERNRQTLRGILDEAAKPAPNRDPITSQIGDYYAACMDEKAIDAKGLKPIQPELDRIAALKDKSGLAAEIAHLHRMGAGTLFDFSSGQDFKDSPHVIAQFAQGALGLPDRDYYFKDDPESIETRHNYVAHLQKIFELAGDKPEDATRHADTAMKFETALAKASLDLVSRRDPAKVYHKMTPRDLAVLSPDFQWTVYFRDAGAPAFNDINVSSPDFARAVNAQIQSVSLDDWKTYLRWHVLHSAARLLPTPFVQENFNFYGKVLTGA